MDLPPMDELEFRKFIPDEEASQTKALNFLWDTDFCGLRGMSDPEAAHPRWNALNRCSDKALLRGSMLKGTAICNYKRGPMNTGQNAAIAKESLALKIRDCATEEWLEQRTDMIAQDAQMDAAATAEEMLAQWKSYNERRPFQVVKGKSWYRLLDSFEELTANWTFVEEEIAAVMEYSEGVEVASGDGDDDDEAGTKEAEPQNKTQFDLLTAGSKNKAHLVWRFIQDRNLQRKLRVFCIGGRFMQSEHVYMLHKMKQGVDGMIEFHADRACLGSYKRTIVPLLRSSLDPNVLQKLGFRQNLTNPVPQNCTEEWYKMELAIIRMKRKFDHCLAADMIWLDAQFFLTLPSKIPALLHSDATKAGNASKYMLLLTNAIVRAEALVKEDAVLRRDLQDLLTKCYYVGEQFARECMAKGLKSKFSPADPEMQSIARVISSGSATTADALEKTFAWVTDKLKHNSKNKMSCAGTKAFYFNTSPYAVTGGMPMLKTTMDDYHATIDVYGDLVREFNEACNMSAKLGSIESKFPKRTVTEEEYSAITQGCPLDLRSLGAPRGSCVPPSWGLLGPLGASWGLLEASRSQCCTRKAGLIIR